MQGLFQVISTKSKDYFQNIKDFDVSGIQTTASFQTIWL